jgi:hypothetical protein
VRRPDRPLTSDGFLAWARSLSADPATVVGHRHRLEEDPVAGGLVAVDSRRLYLAMHDGWYDVSPLSLVDDLDDHLDRVWARSRDAARPLDRERLGPWQRAALVALEQGTTVARLPPGQRVGIDSDADRDHADWCWMRLRRARRDPALTLAAADDWQRQPPDPSRRHTHPCPLCAQPAPHADRYPRAVCDDCLARTVDSTGRVVVGWNTSLGGGFEARYAATATGAGVDDGEVCEEVTRTGEVWVEGHPCRMGEARFGGVVVEAR